MNLEQKEIKFVKYIIESRSFLKILTKILIIIFLVFSLSISAQSLFGDYSQNIEKIMQLTIFYLIINIILNLSRRFINFVYKKRNKFSYDHIDNFTLAVRRIVSLTNALVVFNLILTYFGFNLQTIITSISIVAVALAILFKDILTNFITGFALMFSDDFKLKDYVKIGDSKGRIVDLSFSKLKLRTDDGNFISISNTTAFNSDLINYSKSKKKRVIVDFALNSVYYKFYDELEESISNKVCTEFNEVIEKESFIIKPINIKKDETEFRIEIITNKYNFKIENKIKKFTTKALIRFLAEKKV